MPFNTATTGDGVSVKFVLVWLATCTLQLVTAPLVEPRYFIVPWVVWRLAVPSNVGDADSKGEDIGRTKDDRSSSQPAASEPSILTSYDHRLFLETGWFLLINIVTGWIYLNRTFEWPQEPGRLQRFMW